MQLRLQQFEVELLWCFWKRHRMSRMQFDELRQWKLLQEKFIKIRDISRTFKSPKFMIIRNSIESRNFYRYQKFIYLLWLLTCSMNFYWIDKMTKIIFKLNYLSGLKWTLFVDIFLCRREKRVFTNCQLILFTLFTYVLVKYLNSLNSQHIFSTKNKANSECHILKSLSKVT